MATHIYAGDKRRYKQPFATREDDHIYEGEKNMLESPLLTIVENQIFQGKKGWFESPLATVIEGKVYAGDKGIWENPIATIIGTQVFPGDQGDSDYPIATVSSRDQMAAAAAELAELDIAPVEPEAGGRLFHQLYSVLIQILSRDLVVLVQMVHIPVAVVVVDCKFPYFRMWLVELVIPPAHQQDLEVMVGVPAEVAVPGNPIARRPVEQVLLDQL